MQIAAERDGEAVGHPPAPAESRGAEPAVRPFVRLEKPRTVDHVPVQLLRVQASLQRPAVIVVAGVSADRRQTVRGQREEPGHGRAPRHVLDVRIQAAVLVEDHDGREWSIAGGLHEVSAHGPGRAPGRRILDVPALDPPVGERDHLRLGVPGQERLRHPERGDAADRDRRGAAEKRAPVDITVTVFVIQFEDARVDLFVG